jgi:hypothetical protein
VHRPIGEKGEDRGANVSPARAGSAPAAPRGHAAAVVVMVSRAAMVRTCEVLA